MERQPVSLPGPKIDKHVAIRVLAVARALHFYNRSYVAATGKDGRRLQCRVLLLRVHGLRTRGIMQHHRFQVSRQPVLLRDANRHSTG